MRFTATDLRGVWVIEPERREDERGFFARTFSQDEFETQGLNSRFVQCSISFNRAKGTLRGMHYQIAPYQETKLVRCTAGAMYDVALDLRATSETYKKWFAVELTTTNYQMLYIPEGVAHGFLTLADNTEVLYQISEFYHSEASRGVRWDDSAFGIQWPHQEHYIISERDRNYTLLVEQSS